MTAPSPSGGLYPYGQSQTANLADILERVLDKGVVIVGDIRVNLLDIELLTIKLRLLVASVDKAREIGIDWWEHDPALSSRADRHASRRALEDENEQLRAEVRALRARSTPRRDELTDGGSGTAGRTAPDAADVVRRAGDEPPPGRRGVVEEDEPPPRRRRPVEDEPPRRRQPPEGEAPARRRRPAGDEGTVRGRAAIEDEPRPTHTGDDGPPRRRRPGDDEPPRRGAVGDDERRR
ncbi:gas vesicle protein GvpJ [Streptomyces sp. enrichment culture]|uniref:gas vesicle protein n=1 Tax=Streptomyces sp. enrichment culture TaxID=1795815 RepID=UPI003F570E17